ncbi:MAG: glycosyl hydrolase 115 family protein, partial [Oricola sp.]|nr:glycosyl hydrolase 115 family protein [Oricola sp.]
KEASETPQIWALYKEVQDYYDQGMDVPDDVTLLFADDNWGNIRRLSEPGANRAGGYGVYYHFDYVGGPRNYKWLNTTQIERVWEQMNLAWEYGAKEIWLVNVGDLKPMEFPIDFFLDYAWNPEDLPLERMTDYPRDWAAEQFGEKHAAEIGRMLSAYTKYNARRKPELLDPETYSLVAYDEAARIAAKYGDLAREADALRKKLPPQYDDAYMQLVWHPIQASANLNALYLAAANNRLCAEQARLCANKWADETEALFARDTELTRIYHEEIAEGKWRHLMDQTHIGYTYWQQPDQNTMPPVVRVSGPINADFGVAFDRRREALTTESPALEAAIVLDRNSALGPLKATLFNRRDAAFDFSVETPPWLKAEPAAGRVTDAREISFAVDWTKMPAGETWSDVKVTRKREDGAQSLAFPVRALNREPTGKGGAFVEADGYIAFFAENHARAVNSGGAEWTRIPNLGRERSGMTAFPRAGGAIALEASSPRLEFDFHAFTAGDVAVEVTLAPTLDFKDKGGLKYAVSIDDEPPTVVNVNADASEEAWDESVANYAHQRTSRHEISSAGAHTLKLWLIDPALVFEKITIRSGETPQSYLGPPQSLRASDVEQTVDAED